MKSFQIHINGIVQGVGFRPMVYQLAKKMQLNGYVKNGNDGVRIVFNASEETADLFFKKIKNETPSQSTIISSQLKEIAHTTFSGFSIIVEEDHQNEKQVLISPDAALCAACRKELHDKNNRRYRYPFITCTQCGPRYSIINKLPYERHNTSMQIFSMCKNCNDEYNDITGRRFFSQTNSCEECGIKLSMYQDASSLLTGDTEKVLLHINHFLKEGKIIAVKGIGGYLLLCDARNPETIQILRKRKHRPSKPFAVLYPGIQTVQKHFKLNKQEKDLLQSSEAPVVLLYPNGLAANDLDIQNIAPGLKRLGVMIPYSPLLELIATDYGKPLIATSANISGSPIIYKDEDALAYLFELADTIVSYNRCIIIPEDDSVVKISKHSDQQIILRRSRGYAPSFIHYKPKANSCILSTGAFLKSSFTLSVNGNVFVSQFLGSGESYESQQMYKDTLTHWLKLYAAHPVSIITDLHPGYFSHQYAIELAEKYKADIKFVQHHEAHFAAVLAENNLLHSPEPLLGLIWDGTGLGTDGNIWGGEFFRYENNSMLRCCHFEYFPAIAGDRLASEPRIAALCIANNGGVPPATLKEKFTGTEWNNYQALIKTTPLLSSSVGRIFDAIASLLDLCDKQTYEGEAAMYLEVLAEKYVENNGFFMDESYFNESAGCNIISTNSLVRGIITDIEKGRSKNYVAAKFHYSLVCLVDMVARNNEIKKICFSGGVFQNALLIDWLIKEYSNRYQLYFHQHLSSNDENISFGQLVYHDNKIKTIPEGSWMNKTKIEDLKRSMRTELLLANS